MSTERAREWYKKRRKIFEKMYWGESRRRRDNLYRPSGFKEYPRDIYNLFTSLIDRDGKVVDLGCGNGLLLRHLVQHSRYRLEPYGVDFLEKSIEQAKNKILPEYAQNFTVANIVDYKLEPQSYDFILVDPTSIHRDDIEDFVEKLAIACRPGGKIIFYAYRDVLRVLKILSILTKTIPFLEKNLPWKLHRVVKWVGDILPLELQYRLERIEHKHVSIGVYRC